MFNPRRALETAAGILIAGAITIASAQVNNPGLFQSGAVVVNNCVKWGPGAGQLQDAGAVCAAAPPASANPTATATTTAVNGAAATYMRSDAAPAVAVTTFGGQTAGPGQSAAMQGTGAKIQASTGTTTVNNCVKFDANGNTVDNGTTCATQSVGANPTASATTTAVNGAATTFMRSDAAPAVAVTTFGGQTVGPGGTAAVQGNGAKIQLSTGATVSGNCVKFDVNGNTVDNGSVCAGVTAANPTATASDTAVNGAAGTFMRSDAAPAVQKGTNAQFGVVEGDGSTVSCVAGVCGATTPAWSTFTPTLTCGTGTFTTTSARRLTIGKTTFIELDFTIATLGTCSNALTFTLPNTPQSGGAFIITDVALTGACSILPANATATCAKFSAASYIAGEHYTGSGIYENQ